MIFKKDVIEESVPEEENAVDGEMEIKWIEKAMTVKNPEVKKHLAEGWAFVEKIWSSEKNMYLAKVQRRFS
ncbi:hypothetical protein F7731_23830 [Cytobacillus depressus]|uniref:Uncharacterized protein n=2 Tax=Cytobacillus depressus TaxID=1602942 RepID=A0A6L3V059_9BACI|nr:hypothetical protein F7731_23830 [Cytobacillus depressus]